MNMHFRRPPPGGKSIFVGGFQWIHPERGFLSVAGNGEGAGSRCEMIDDLKADRAFSASEVGTIM